MAARTRPGTGHRRHGRCKRRGPAAHTEIGTAELSPVTPQWVISNTGADLVQALQRALDHGGLASAWQRDLNAAEPLERWRLARGWLRAFAATQATAGGATRGLAWID